MTTTPPIAHPDHVDVIAAALHNTLPQASESRPWGTGDVIEGVRLGCAALEELGFTITPPPQPPDPLALPDLIDAGDLSRLVRVDAQARINVARLGLEHGQRFILTRRPDGSLLLDPAVEVPHDHPALPCSRCKCRRDSHAGPSHAGACTRLVDGERCLCDRYRYSILYTRPTEP